MSSSINSSSSAGNALTEPVLEESTVTLEQPARDLQVYQMNVSSENEMIPQPLLPSHTQSDTAIVQGNSSELKGFSHHETRDPTKILEAQIQELSHKAPHSVTQSLETANPPPSTSTTEHLRNTKMAPITPQTLMKRPSQSTSTASTSMHRLPPPPLRTVDIPHRLTQRSTSLLQYPSASTSRNFSEVSRSPSASLLTRTARKSTGNNSPRNIMSKVPLKDSSRDGMGARKGQSSVLSQRLTTASQPYLKQDEKSYRSNLREVTTAAPSQPSIQGRSILPGRSLKKQSDVEVESQVTDFNEDGGGQRDKRVVVMSQQGKDAQRSIDIFRKMDRVGEGVEVSSDVKPVKEMLQRGDRIHSSNRVADSAIPTHTPTEQPTYTLSIPQDPKKQCLITVINTDGTKAKWPTARDYHLANNARNISWKTKIGEELAQLLSLDTSRKWMLDSWPPGYCLYVHERVMSGKSRVDAYLHGSKSVAKFRSPNEFVPHIYSLCVQRPPFKTANCECKYCAGNKYQRDINTVLNLTGQRSILKSLVTGQKRKRNPIVGLQESKATLLPSPIVKTKRYFGPFISPEREKDLSYREYGIDGVFRIWELVWMVLENTISDDESDLNITRWPAMIKDKKWKPQKLSKEEGLLPDPLQQVTAQGRFIYTVSLLGCSDIFYEVEVSALLPWLAISFDKSRLVKDLVRRPLLSNSWIEDASIKRTRQTINTMSSFYDTYMTYILGVVMGSHIVKLYHSIDSYKITTHNMVKSNDSQSSTKSKHKFYQGIWWGAERIWAGELIRVYLKAQHLEKIGILNMDIQGSEELIMKLDCMFIRKGKKFMQLAGSLFAIRPTSSSQLAPITNLLPPSPTNYEFIPLTSSDTQHVLPITVLAGRYYPPNHIIDGINLQESVKSRRMQSKFWCKTRTRMFIEAESAAEKKLIQEWKKKSSEMEVETG